MPVRLSIRQRLSKVFGMNNKSNSVLFLSRSTINYSLLILTVTVSVLLACSKQEKGMQTITWKLDNLSEIGGLKPTVLGEPIIVDAPIGKAIQFDGKDDAILLQTNPLAHFSTFTIEIIFRPDSGGNKEQRFFHVQEEENHRVLVETRLTENNTWFFDTFIKWGENERTLDSENVLHPVNKWYHGALVYDGSRMHHYINGVREMVGPVEYRVMKNGQTSIGCRLNRVFWFKGAIKTIRISQGVRSPKDFLSLQNKLGLFLNHLSLTPGFSQVNWN